jgi:NAD(P)H-dependent FMN reductase
MSLKITIIYGSYRSDRQGIRVVKYLTKALEEQKHIVTFVDAKACNVPMLDKRYIDYAPTEIPPKLQELKDLFEKGTDVFVVVSGEYNSTMQPGLMNLLDHFYVEFFYRPCGVVTYSMGALGGARVSQHLRGTLCEFGMSPLPSIFSVPVIHEALDPDGNDTAGAFSKKRDKFLKEIKWYGEAFKNAHKQGKP